MNTSAAAHGATILPSIKSTFCAFESRLRITVRTCNPLQPGTDITGSDTEKSKRERSLSQPQTPARRCDVLVMPVSLPPSRLCFFPLGRPSSLPTTTPGAKSTRHGCSVVPPSEATNSKHTGPGAALRVIPEVHILRGIVMNVLQDHYWKLFYVI